MEDHKAAIQKISDQVQKFHSTQTPFRIYHGSTLSTRPSERTKLNMVDISKLNKIISIDHDRRIALVEPNVPMDALVAATMAEGFLPPVVMELPNITAGGGFAGTSGESSSFRYGTFDCTVGAIEVVLGDGNVMVARKGNHVMEELLYGCAGACGTLGIVTLLEISLIPAKTYVELTYWPVSSVTKAVEKLREVERVGRRSVDFVDGILFGKTEGVIMTGKLTDEKIEGREVQRFDRASDPWFYLHAKDVLKKKTKGDKEPYRESIPTPSYLFRYDRAVFWSGELAFRYFWFPFNAVTRLLLDPLMRTRVVNHALHRSGIAERGIIQDLGIPYSRTEEFVDYLSEKVGIWPLWLCPVRSPYTLGRRSFSTGIIDMPHMLLDIGVWGMGPSDPSQFIRLNRDIESKVTELGGVKCLYAHAYYTESEFWDIYNEKGYRELRRIWKAESLPSIYDKVKVDLKGVRGGGLMWEVRGRLSGVYGVLSALKGMVFGGDFMLKKK